jgi:hypothetical protein
MKYCLITLFMFSFFHTRAQQTDDVQTLKKEILELKLDVQNIQLNLVKSEKKFKRGIFVATLGYSITITGGLMLGRKNDELGKVLLVAGGATGVTGTGMMLNAFNYLGRAGRSKRE